MATPEADIKTIPTTPIAATESSEGGTQDTDHKEKISSTPTNGDITAPVTKSEFIALVVEENIAADALYCRFRD